MDLPIDEVNFVLHRRLSREIEALEIISVSNGSAGEKRRHIAVGGTEADQKTGPKHVHESLIIDSHSFTHWSGLWREL
jgi:hypothetical protein